MNTERIYKRLAVVTVSALAILGLSTVAGNAAVTTISIGKASNFGLVVGGGLTNVGQSTISGDLALTPIISYTDTGPLTLQGSYHFGDAAALAAQADAGTAYAAAVSETPTVTVASELAGKSLLPGIYSSATGFTINGSLNLDAQNNPNALFIMQTPASLGTGTASHVNLLNGAQACNVFWQVGTTSTLGAGSDFKGNILGKGNFVSAAGSVVLGRVLIAQGSASLNATQITRPKCKVVEVEPTPTVNLGEGGGDYVSQYGNANFNFNVKGTDLGNGTFANVGGRVSWNVERNWKFNGLPTAYSYANGAGTITGTGMLSYFSTPKKEWKHWQPVAAGIVNFTVKYTRAMNSNGTVGKVNSFAIGFTGSTIAGVPQLPALGALVLVKGGGDGSND